MFSFGRFLVKNTKIFLTNFTSHFIYTFVVIVLSSLLTYFLLASLTSPATISSKTGTTVILPNQDSNLYVERGSPYDNRTIGSHSANVMFHGPRNKKQVALTFDAEMTDGMKASLLSGAVKTSYNKKIIDILNATNTKATLFLTGLWIELYPDVTKQLSNNPLFELGSHSYTDSSYYGFCYGLKQIASTIKIEEIGATEKLLREHARIDNQLFRFPGGCYTPSDVKLVNDAGDTVVHWDVVGADGFNKNTNQIIHNVVDNAQNGSIVVLHLNGSPTAPKTAEALPGIISGLKARGFDLVKVNELLGLPLEIRTN